MFLKKKVVTSTKTFYFLCCKKIVLGEWKGELILLFRKVLKFNFVSFSSVQNS